MTFNFTQNELAIEQRIIANNVTMFTVCKDYHLNGKPYWRVLAGSRCNEGFEWFKGPTKQSALDYADEKQTTFKYLNLKLYVEGRKFFNPRENGVTLV